MLLALIVSLLGGLFLICSTVAMIMKRRRQVRTIRAIEAHPVMQWYRQTQREQK